MNKNVKLHSNLSCLIVGLRPLKSILLQGHYELRVDLEDTSGQQLFAQYDVFDMSTHVDHYTLFGYSGTAGRSLVHFHPLSTLLD